MACPSCGLVLPERARFCARCGTALGRGGAPATAVAGQVVGPPVAPVARPDSAPVWVLVLLWLGAGGLLWVAASYAALALGVVPTSAIGAQGDDQAIRGASTLLAAIGASLCIGHAAAAIGLMTGRSWGRPFATLVCAVWALTCVGLPVALFAISSMWRGARRSGPPGPAPSRTSP